MPIEEDFYENRLGPELIILPSGKKIFDFSFTEMFERSKLEWQKADDSLEKKMSALDLYATKDMKTKTKLCPRPVRLCSCREILSRRRGFVCMTGAKPCPHCGLRVPMRAIRDFPQKSVV